MKTRILKLLGVLWIVCLTLGGNNNQHTYAAANKESTETQKVPIDSSVAIASTEKYKDMDYSFLKTFQYGSSTDVSTTFNSVDDMIGAQLTEGKQVKTKGFYNPGDQGAAVYVIGSKQESGGIQLNNGLYANVVPDEYVDAEGVRWLIGNVKQFGAKGDAKHEDHEAINYTASRIGQLVNEEGSKYQRGIIYLPSGEYKLGFAISVGYSNLNFVGDGDNSVIFTDNDYRDEEGYSEFLFSCWGTNNCFFGNFKIDAREVDLYHYMRQFVVLYSENVYVYKVNLYIPQSTYNSYYFEDKQYSNFCCYSGNKNITVDSCTMEQMSGTYRGANLGVLDIWAAGEENITIMNCDFYGNARDEQIGFFSKNDPNASLKNVNFINNTMHSVQLKYVDIIGNRTMCFTIAYADSQNVDGIRIAGNHFICETDSKFMTFGKMKNCKVENNTIEVKCTYSSWSMLFDVSNPDPENIVVQNNDIFITTDVGKGRGNITGGNLTLKNNNILFDTQLTFGIYGPEIHDNKIVGLAQVGTIGENSNITGNEIYLYNELGSVGTNKKQVAVYVSGNENAEYKFSNNKVYDYRRCTEFQGLRSILKLDATFKSLVMENNEIYFPNTKFITADYTTKEYWLDENGQKYYKNRILRTRSGNYSSILVKNNKFQNTLIPESDGVFRYVNNIEIPYEEDLSEELTTKVEILYKGKSMTDLTTTEDVVDLDSVEYVATEKDTDGNVIKQGKIEGKQIKWYSSSDRIATVSDDGRVTKKMNGEVHIYAVPLDGANVYGECVVNFENAMSQTIKIKDNVLNMEPGIKYYSEYEVLPKGASQKLNWKSSDENIAAVDIHGTVTAKKEGNVIITATTKDGSEVSASYKVVVNKLTVKKINMEHEYIYFDNSKIGTAYQLKVANYYPEDATNKGVSKWTSSDEKVAKVDQNGMVTIKGVGKCIIYAHALNNACKGETYIYVQPGKLENLSAEATNDTVLLRWNAQEGARGYFLYQWDETKLEWGSLNEGNAITDTQFSIKKLDKNKKYKFAVRSYIHRWEIGSSQEIYYSAYNEIEIKTLSYSPVVGMSGSYTTLAIPLDKTVKFEVKYSPANADYPKLDILVENSNSDLAKIERKTITAGTYTYEVSGMKYGRTDLKFTVNDDLKKSLSVPVYVMTQSQVEGKEQTVVSAESKGVRISFPAIENESELLKVGAITGYMIRRTVTSEFSNLEYIPASGLAQYEYLDTSVMENRIYSYTIAPCVKMDDATFVGKTNGTYKVTTLEEKKATSVEMKNKLVVLSQGNGIVVSAKVGPEDAKTSSLKWYADNSNIVTVEHRKTEEEKCIDYAIVTGTAVGTTKVIATTVDGSGVLDEMTVVVSPSKIQNLCVAQTETSIGLSWDAVENASGYFVYRYDEKTQSWNKIADVSSNSYRETILDTTQSYNYMISGYILYENEKYEGVLGDSLEAENSDFIEDGSDTKVYGVSIQYDGKPHSAVMIKHLLDTDKVEYSLDNNTWTQNIPTVTNVVDSKIIQVRITRGENVYRFSVLAIIRPIDISDLDISLDASAIEWNGKKQYPKIVISKDYSNIDYSVNYSGNGKKVGHYMLNVIGCGNYIGTKSLKYSINVYKNKCYTVNSYKYKVISSGKVSIQKLLHNNKKSVVIPTRVSIGGKKFKITQIEKKAFSNNNKLRKVTIGSEITRIGGNAFSGDKMLKKVVIKSAKLNKIEKNAWNKINPKAKFIVRAKKMKLYEKMLKKSNGYLKESMTIEKIKVKIS